MSSLIGGFASLDLIGIATATREVCFLGHDLHTEVLEVHTDASRELLQNLTLASHYLRELELGLWDGETVFAPFASLSQQMCGVEERLGGDTPFVEANPTELILLEDNDLQATCSSMLGCVCTTRARPDDR